MLQLEKMNLWVVRYGFLKLLGLLRLYHLVPLCLKESSDHFPLISLGEECAKHFGFNKEEVDEVGNYFVLATVFPSCKVMKNGVRLSSNLACSMGYPTSGSMIFVYPVDCQLKMDVVNGNDILSSLAPNSFPIYKCKKLYLSLVSSKSGFRTRTNTPSYTELCNGQVTNGKISSPKTPSLTRSKFSSHSSSKLSSPGYTGSLLTQFDLDQPTFDSFNIREVLEDEVGKKLLQTCALSILCSRHLLYGNLVVIPILSNFYLFKVIYVNKVRHNGTTENIEETSGSILQCPDGAYHLNHAIVVGHGTQVHLFSPLSSALEDSDKTCLGLETDDLKDNVAIDYPNLGGLAKEYSVMKDIITSSSKKGTLSSMGLRPTKGVLLHGPSGTGKTSLARLCAHDAGFKLFSVNGPEVVSAFYGESEQALHKVFDSASRAAPAVVFIDELDAIAPSRKEGMEELSQRMVATLLDLMDGISRNDGVLVIAATNRLDSIEPALRRPGRLDKEIEIGVPSPSQRYDILLALLKERGHTLKEMEIHNLAMTSHGFVGADLAALCNEAALFCLRRCIDKIPCEESLCDQSSLSYDGHSDDKMKASSSSEENKDDFSADNLDFLSSSMSELHLRSVESYKAANVLKISLDDFEKAQIKVRPSAMREVILEVPKVSWLDVGGQEEVKMQLMEAVEWPQKHQGAFKRIGTHPPTGVLLFGPPGCSKTLLARAVASEVKLNFLAVKGPELFSKWVGESEKAVRSLFAKARANAPSIIFLMN